MAPESQRNRLPFEPNKKRQKQALNSQKPPETAKKAEKAAPESAKKAEKTPVNREETAIPKVVSDRMARRMALFCGVPTALGMVTFIVSYFIVSQGWLNLPNAAVMLVSMGFFGLGVLGLSYGVISASWDEEIVGSKLGWQQFTTNWGRMMSAWRSARQKKV